MRSTPIANISTKAVTPLATAKSMAEEHLNTAHGALFAAALRVVLLGVRPPGYLVPPSSCHQE